MLATKCDRCQKFFEGKQIPKIRYKHGNPNSDIFELDICEECLDEFFRFIKMTDKEQNTEIEPQESEEKL